MGTNEEKDKKAKKSTQPYWAGFEHCPEQCDPNSGSHSKY
jgi:hypothetical protein